MGAVLRRRIKQGQGLRTARCHKATFEQVAIGCGAEGGVWVESVKHGQILYSSNVQENEENSFFFFSLNLFIYILRKKGVAYMTLKGVYLFFYYCFILFYFLYCTDVSKKKIASHRNTVTIATCPSFPVRASLPNRLIMLK